MGGAKIKYTSSPLPFIGQKRMWIKEIEDVVTNEFKNIKIFIDLFGGSGLVSHTIKQARPDAIVIWNDYDNFKERLDNIEQTNEIIEKIRPFLLGKKKRNELMIPQKK